MEIFKTRDEFAKWADLFRKKGIESIQIDGVTIKFSAEALFPESDYQRNKKEQSMKEEQVNALEEAEKTLFWSAPDVGTQQ